MKKIILIGLTAISSLAFGQKYLDMIEKGTYSIDQIKESAEKYFDGEGRGKGTGYKQYQRWLYMARRGRVNENGVLISNNDQLKSLRTYKRQIREQEVPGFSSTATWQNLGPTYKNGTSGWNPGVGRITSVGVDESDLNHFIVGGPNCGVWKTTDNGANWTNLTDGFSDLNVWSLEISQHDKDVYYWGSNSGYMYKSTNGGSTWNTLSYPGSGDVRRILIHPDNPNIVFACSNDLYKSTDGGTSWTSVQSQSGYDIEFKPGDPSVVYYSGNSVYKSTDGGDNFTIVNGGFNSSETKMMAVTPDNPGLLLVLEERSKRFGGLYKSTNSGASFTKIQTGSADVNNMFGYKDDGTDDRGQAPRDMDIIIDPADENTVILAGIQCWKSVNGGTSFSINTYWTPGGASSRGVGYNHADVDVLKWHSGKIFSGSDGGIYTSTNDGASYDDKTTGISCREFYKIGVSKTDPNVVTGGSQDNGTSVMKGNDRGWYCWLGADGMESFVDWSNPNKLYGTSQYGSLYKSTNQGSSYSGMTEPSGDDDGDWVTPFEQDPIDASVVYAGFKNIWKTSDDGSNWTQISTFGNTSPLNEMKLAASNNSYIYASQGSNMWVTKNAGSTWTSINPGSYVNYIHVSPNDPERVVAVTSGSIYVSTDAGDSWVNYTKNLPNVNYYCAVWADNIENGLYVGGLGFVSYIEDGMTDYVDFWDNLPMCKVNELEINYVSNTIFAATYGRGLWESDLYTEVSLDYDAAVSDLTDVPSRLCGSSVNPSVKITNKGAVALTSLKIEVYLNNSVIETINHSTNLAQGAEETIVLSQVTYASSGNNDIKVVVSEPNGNSDEKISNNEVEESTSVSFGTPHVFYIDERSSSTSLAWYLRNDQSQIVESGSYGSTTLVNSELQEEVCLAEGCYDFVISDAFNSGQCSAQSWQTNTEYCIGIQVAHNGRLYESKWCGSNNEPGQANYQWTDLGECAVSYDTDVYGFKEEGEEAYFEVEVQNYTSPKSDNFCFGSNLVVDFSADAQVVNHCTDVEFTANVSGGTPTDYSWSFGADASPSTATGEGPHTVKYLNGGIKAVSLTVDGVTESKGGFMMVSTDVSKAVTAEIALSNSPTCEGDQMDFTATLSNEGVSPTYSWMVNNSEEGTSSTFTSDVLVNGDIVTLKVTSDDECSVPDNITSDDYIVNLTTNVTPTIQIAEVQGEEWPICMGGIINLEASTTNGGQTPNVSWSVNGHPIGNSNPIEYSGDNGDVIKATLNSSVECVAANDIESNEITSVVDVCVSTNEVEDLTITTFPNPVVEMLTVEGNNVSKLEVTEVSGKLISVTNVNTNVTKIDLSQLATGSYLLKVEFKSGGQETIDIQKK